LQNWGIPEFNKLGYAPKAAQDYDN